MSDQVITIHNDGSISGLERKDGLDFKVFGDTVVERTSEIVWSTQAQKWRVEFIHLDTFLFDENGLIALFDTYQEAVDAEIAYLDALRVKGLLTQTD